MTKTQKELQTTIVEERFVTWEQVHFMGEETWKIFIKTITSIKGAWYQRDDCRGGYVFYKTLQK